MVLIYLYSFVLILGLIISQVFDVSPFRQSLYYLTDVCLASIMMEVGLELTLDKKNWHHYIWDYFVAVLAGTLPWLFCFAYFYFFFAGDWKETILIASFAAPTSSGILFSMLAAAGLGTSWLFKKVQILAIFDDIYTILLMIPLQFLLIGVKAELYIVGIIIIIFVVLGWKFLHRLKLPSGRLWIFGYGLLMTTIFHTFHATSGVEIEIILPAFIFGAMLFNPHDPQKPKVHYHEHAYIEPVERPFLIFDRILKTVFMFLVGLTMPMINLENLSIWMVFGHVIAITLISNLGKCFPMFCYKKEASLKERIAVGVSMFPRGELGAGILLLAIQYGMHGPETTIATLSVALNLLLTGVFMSIVIKLVRKRYA